MSGKYYAYIRVSGKNREKDVQILETRNNTILKYVNKKKITITETFTDYGKSGMADGRQPQLKQLLEKMKKGDTLLVSNLSRLARKMIDYSDFIIKVRKNKCDLYIIKEDLDFSAINIFKTTLLMGTLEYKTDSRLEEMARC